MRNQLSKGIVIAVASAMVGTGVRLEASDATWSAYQQAAVDAAKLKDYAKAKRLFGLAAKEAAVHHPEGDPHRLLESTLGISGILIHEADYADAEMVLKDALRLSEPIGPEHPVLGRVHSDLSHVFFKTGKLDDAEKHVRAALIVAEAQESPAQISSLLNDLANIERGRENYEQAESLARRALTLAESTDGTHLAQVAATLDTLAEIHHDRGQHEQALPLAEQAHRMASSTLGAGHPFLADVHDTLADIHAALNHKDKAVAHSRQAAEINSAHFHRDHHIVLDSVAGLKKRLTAAVNALQAAKAEDEPDSRPAGAADIGQGEVTSSKSNSTAPASR